MPGRAAERGQIRSAVREEAGQGGAQSAPTASASPARRRTRRGIQPPDAPDCHKRHSGASFLNRGKPSYAHGYTNAHRRGRKQYAIPQNKNAPRPKRESPCAPPKFKNASLPMQGSNALFPMQKKRALLYAGTMRPARNRKATYPPKAKIHIPAPKQENMYPSRNKKQHASPEAKRDGALFAAASAAHCIGRLSGNAKRKKPLQIQKI